MPSHVILRDWWSATGVEVRSRPTSEAEIAALEARYRVKLPSSFRDYVKYAIPAIENWDAEDGNWWPLQRIRSISEEYKQSLSGDEIAAPGQHLFFLDWSIWCCAWAVSCADDKTHGKIALVGGLPDGYVADSFDEFVEKYTTDWMSIGRIQPITK